ncbi:MAG: hypothetical protein NC337_05530 [Roseburia sp.]|nr:hypothetical protein [Roseburia sp.]
MFQIVLFTEKERRELIGKYGTENISIEWIPTEKNYPRKSLRRYLSSDEFGVYKKHGVKIPYYLKREYRKARNNRERRIYTKFYHLHTSVRYGKRHEYFMFDYRFANLSEDDIMEMIKLLEMG